MQQVPCPWNFPEVTFGEFPYRPMYYPKGAWWSLKKYAHLHIQKVPDEHRLIKTSTFYSSGGCFTVSPKVLRGFNPVAHPQWAPLDWLSTLPISLFLESHPKPCLGVCFGGKSKLRQAISVCMCGQSMCTLFYHSIDIECLRLPF